MKRCDLRYTAWTEIYAEIATATNDAAPMFSRQLRDLCDMSIARSGRDAVPGGYFDGPLAWRMLNHKLKGAKRTEVDKDFYRTAERLQRQNPLPDGCTADEYSKKAFAFLVHILPNMVQPYDADETTKYIVRQMPACLRDTVQLVYCTRTYCIHHTM